MALNRRLAKADGYRAYADDPTGFIRDVLGEHAWRRQAEIAESVRDHSDTAVPSCFGSGKSWIAARIVAWWVCTGGVAITTADTFRQVRDILWRELRRAHAQGDLPGKIPAVECRWEAGAGAWAVGIKPGDWNAEGFQGIHGTKVLTVYDEANGIPGNLWESGRGLAVSASDRRLAIGNPYEPIGPFWEACRSRSWNVLPIAAIDTPLFTGEWVPAAARDGLISPEWVERLRAEGLEGTPFWVAKVEGRFPDTASNAILPLSWVEAARALPHHGGAEDFAGLDVARFGSDDTVLLEGEGNGPVEATVLHGHDTMETAGLGARFLRERRGTLAIDAIGVGAGVVDRLVEQRLPGAVIDVNVGEGAQDPSRYINLRAELWWALREAFGKGEISLAALPEVPYLRLREELTAVRYRLTSAGKVQVESKEEMRARGTGSPDAADALALWYYARARRTARSFHAGVA